MVCLDQPFKTRNQFQNDQISLSIPSPRRHTNLPTRGDAPLWCGKPRRRRRRLSSQGEKKYKRLRGFPQSCAKVAPYSRFAWANSVKVIPPLVILDGPIIIDSRFRSVRVGSICFSRQLGLGKQFDFRGALNLAWNLESRCVLGAYVPTLTSPKIDQNRPKSPNTPPSSGWNLRDNCGAYLTRNII